MMSIIEIKQTLTNNLDQKNNILENIPVNALGIVQFITDLTDSNLLDNKNATITSPDENSIQLDINFKKTWKIGGVAIGQIKDATATILLEQQEESTAIRLELAGTFEVKKLNRSFPVTGALADADGWVIELGVDTGDLPTLEDLAAMNDLSDLNKNLKDIGLELPKVEKVWFGYNLSMKSFAFVGVSGGTKLGKAKLETTCLFNPDLIIFGGLAEGSQIKLSDVLKTLDIDGEALPDVALSGLDISIHPASKSFSASAEVEGNWSVGKIGSSEFVIEKVVTDFSKSPGNTSLTLQGISHLFSSDLYVSAVLSKDLQMSATATNINLNSIVDAFLDDVELPDGLPNVVLDVVNLTISPLTKEVALSATSLEDWEIPVGIVGIKIENLKLSFDRKAGTKKNTFITTGTFSGEAKIGTISTALVYNFPGDFIFKTTLPEIDLSPVIQDLCGTQALMGISVPSSVTNVKLSDIQIMAAPKRKIFSMFGKSPLGETELIVNKNQQNKWTFVVAFAPPETWKFSSLDNTLTPLDTLSLANTAMVLSSETDRSVPLSVIEIPSDISIGRGLTFFSALDLTNLGVKDLMDISMITVSANIDRNPANLKLAAAMGGTFKISDNVAMGNMNFFIKPSPANFELGISGSVLAKIDSSDLEFVGTMGIRPIERSAAFSSTMLGFWKEPFGIKGLQVGNLALEVGIGIVPPPAVALPIVGFAGTITVGTVTGSAAVKADTANPTKSMIAASFNRLYLKEVIQTFCDKKVYNKIPSEIRNTVLAAGLEDVGVYVVPQPTTIGELFYDQGFKFEGKLSIGDFDAQFFFLLSYSEGFAIKASMDPIKIGNAFELSGTGEFDGPTLDVDLRLGGKPGIAIAGLARILGIQAQTLVSINDRGFIFFVEGKIFDLFLARLNIRGGNLKDGGDFYVKAEMRNDLLSYLRKEARKGIQEAGKAATKDIEKAQKAVDVAQKEVNKLQRNIDSMRKTIKAERARDTKKVKNAEKAVSNAQKEVNKLQGNINSMRKTIKAERARDTKKLRDAQKAVSKAQKTVNGIQGEINRSKSRIKTLNSHIKAKKRWYDNSGWKKSYRWAEYSGYVTAKGAEITALYTKIGTLEGSKATANGVLEAAKQVVRGIEAAAKTFPIDADPRIVGLFTAKGTAVGVLEGAKQTLKLVRAAIKTFPIDADPRIVGLFTAKGTATIALQGTKGVLEGVKITVGGLANVGDFIVKHGLGGLVDVKEARFEGQLNVLKGGAVSMGMKLILLKKPFNLDLSFNFNNMTKTVDQFTKKLIAEIK